MMQCTLTDTYQRFGETCCRFLRNITTYQRNYAVLHPRRPKPWYSPTRESEISHMRVISAFRNHTHHMSKLLQRFGIHCSLYLHSTALKIAIVMYAETLHQPQHTMRLQPESRSYTLDTGRSNPRRHSSTGERTSVEQSHSIHPCTKKWMMVLMISILFQQSDQLRGLWFAYN
jgi:hypothetical protein